MIKPLYTIMVEEVAPHKLIPRHTIDRMRDIAVFNSTMSTAEVIKLHNRIIEKEQEKKKLIETFTNQLYAYFLERKKQGEQKY